MPDDHPETAGQRAAFTNPRKSTTADATARSWIVIADARTVYIAVMTGDFTAQYFGAGFWRIATTSAPRPLTDNFAIGGTTDSSQNSTHPECLAPDITTQCTGHAFSRGYQWATGSSG